MPPKTAVRVRIAPSPSGFLHMGTARTALFNYLFAKHHGGTFIVRIEDTDTERSEKRYEDNILEGLQWLGLDWDEGPVSPEARKSKFQNPNFKDEIGNYGPYRQSERTDTYERYIKKLLAERHAYYCFCTKEELEAEKSLLAAEGKPPRYSGKCRVLTDADVVKRQSDGVPSVIRFKVPEREVSFTDLIRGKTTFDMALSGDVVIAKSTREPLYNFAVTVDDYEMRITHVIRGEDHIANTPKQLVFQEALGFSHPHFAHVPLILDAKRAKLSKRDGATNIDDYRRAGYLPHAMVNFLALLGWHPEGNQELFTLPELVSIFSLERVQKGGAVFNVEKLDWLNGQYLTAMDPQEILNLLMRDFGVKPNGLDEDQLLALITLVRGRMKKLSEFRTLTDFFFALPEYSPDLLIWKETSRERTLQNLASAHTLLSALHPVQWKREHLDRTFEPLTTAEGKGEVLWPLRVALSGHDVSPGPFEIMEILGKTESVSRIKKAMEKLEK